MSFSLLSLYPRVPLGPHFPVFGPTYPSMEMVSVNIFKLKNELHYLISVDLPTTLNLVLPSPES